MTTMMMVSILTQSLLLSLFVHILLIFHLLLYHLPQNLLSSYYVGNLSMVVRTELHSWLNKRGSDQFMNIYSLNEWDSRFSGGIVWRQKIDQQRGAVLATELKNNSCKLAKWTAQSILSGADNMKLGYVSRTLNTNQFEHQILATQFFKPRDLAAQINLNVNNMWGIVKMICDLGKPTLSSWLCYYNNDDEDEEYTNLYLCFLLFLFIFSSLSTSFSFSHYTLIVITVLTKEDGKFVLMKDPNKATLRLYLLPEGALDEEEEEEEEEDDDDEEEGDDGEKESAK